MSWGLECRATYKLPFLSNLPPLCSHFLKSISVFLRSTTLQFSLFGAWVNFSNPSFQICWRSNNLSSSRNAWMQCLGKALTGEGARCGVESAEKHTLVIDSFLRQCLLSLQSASVSRRFLSSFLLCPLLYIYCSVAHMHLHSAFGYCILCNQSNPYQ